MLISCLVQCAKSPDRRAWLTIGGLIGKLYLIHVLDKSRVVSCFVFSESCSTNSEIRNHTNNRVFVLLEKEKKKSQDKYKPLFSVCLIYISSVFCPLSLSPSLKNVKKERESQWAIERLLSKAQKYNMILNTNREIKQNICPSELHTQ